MPNPLLTPLTEQLEPIPDYLLERFFPATHYLQERRPYFPALLGVDELRVNDAELLCPAVTYGDIRFFNINIQDSLGLTSLQPITANQPAGEPLWVEVLCSKYPTPQKHLDFCQTIITDLFQNSANLPFNFSNQTQRGVKESLQPPSPIFTYHFLKKSLEQFRAAIEMILAQPHRVLCDQEELVMLHEASEVDGDVILSILQAPERWVKTSGFEFSPTMRIDGKPYAPQQVWQRLSTETFDTPENRFVLHFLCQVLITAERLPAQSWWKFVAKLDETKVFEELTSTLREAVSHPMFAEVGEMGSIPSHSQVLMRREGYRDLMELWQQFHSSRSPLFDRWQQAIDLRKVFDLYELWVLFILIQEISQFDPIQTLVVGFSDEDGVEYESNAIFNSGGLLFYNLTFRFGLSNLNRSYSMELRPDYVWRGHGRQVILDAKFSLSIVESEPDSEINGEGNPGQREEYPVRENLNKMHTYRDALVGTQAAVILYPGNKPVFMPIGHKRVRDFTLQEVLTGRYERTLAENATLSIRLDGIGALVFKPNLG